MGAEFLAEIFGTENVDSIRCYFCGPNFLLKVAVIPKDIIEELILTEVFNFFIVKFLELILLVKHFFARNSGKCDKNVSCDEITHLLENRFQVFVVCRNFWVLCLTAFL